MKFLPVPFLMQIHLNNRPLFLYIFFFLLWTTHLHIKPEDINCFKLICVMPGCFFFVEHISIQFLAVQRSTCYLNAGNNSFSFKINFQLFGGSIDE